MADNAVDAYLSDSRKSGNAADAFLAKKPGGNAVDSFLHSTTAAVGGTMERLGVPRLIDVLDRPRQTVQAAIAGDDPLRTFLHHAGPDQQNADRAKVRAKFGLPGDAERAQLGGFRGGLDDFATDTVTDPFSLLGGFAFRGLGAAAKGALHGGEAIGKKVAPKFTDFLGAQAHEIGDKFTYGGSAKRELGTPKYNEAIAADNRQASRQAEATRRLQERADALLKPLAPDDEHAVYRILNGEELGKDPNTGRVIAKPHVMAAAAGMRKLLNDAAALQANESGRRRLGYNLAPLANDKYASQVEPWQLSYAKRNPTLRDARMGAPNPSAAALRLGMEHPDDVRAAAGPRRLVGRVDRKYDVPDDLKEFAAPDDQGVMGTENLRRNYLPGPHAQKAAASDARPRSFNLLRPFAPNIIQRDEFSVAADDAPKIREALMSALENAARQATAGRLRHEVGVPLSENALTNNALEKLFEVQPRARGDARTIGEKRADYWSNVVNIPKNTVTTLGLKHGLFNVPALALMSEGPGAAAEALLGGARLAMKKPGQRYEALRPGIEGGVIAPFADRQNPIADTLARAPGMLGQLLGGASKGANNLTWAIDDAAKQAVLKRKLARGMAPADAAAEALREMVDYRHRSQATKAAGAVAPFATFRTRVPAAIASSAARHPERLLALDRATQGGASNGRVDVNGHRVTLTTPISDALELGDEPQAYLRAMLADPIKLGASAIAPHVKIDGRRWPSVDASRDEKAAGPTWHSGDRYMTYGKPVLPYKDSQGRAHVGALAQSLIDYTPAGVGEQALNLTDLGNFGPQDWISALLGGTLGAHVR